MARFLIATMPITGHVQPALAIARGLLARGHEVGWYTGSRFRSRVEAAGARYLPMRAAPDYDDLDLNGAFPGRADLADFAQFKFDMTRLFADAAPGQLRDLEELLPTFPADVLVCDTGFFGASLLHEKRGQRWAGFGVTALTFASRDTAPFGLGLPPSSSPLGRLRNRALNLLFDRVLMREVNAHWNRVRASVGLPATRRSFLSFPLSPYLYLQGTTPSFEYPRSDLPAQVRFVGPFLPEPPADVVAPGWWHELADAARAGRPFVHVTQGTSATDAEQLVVPTLRALAEEDVLVVATTGGKPVEAVGLDPLPANARLERFIPYHHLLPHVTAMVTNGGYGGVQLALAHGVPLVAAGSTEDKPEVASRIGWSGVGVNLRTKTPTPEQVRQAVRTVLTEPRYRRRALELRAELAGCDGSAEAARLLERLADGGRPETDRWGEAAPRLAPASPA